MRNVALHRLLFLVACFSPALTTLVEGATVRVSNYALPPGQMQLVYQGVLSNTSLPAALTYGEGSGPVNVALGDFVIKATHGNTSITPALCRGTVSDDAQAVLVAITAVVSSNASSLTCITTSTSSRSRLNTGSLVLSFVNLSPKASIGKLGLYSSGTIYQSPCHTVSVSPDVTFGHSAVLPSVSAGRYDLAFIRQCANNATDIPLVLEAIALTSGNAYTIALVGDPDIIDAEGALKLAVITASRGF